MFFYLEFLIIRLSDMLSIELNRVSKAGVTLYLHKLYNDNASSFTDLLEIDNSVSVHHRNIKVLAIELYIFVNGLSPKLVSGGSLSILSQFPQSFMTQNHSLTWD